MIHRNHHIFISWKSWSRSQAIELVNILQLCKLQVSSLLVIGWYKVTSHSTSHVLPRLNGYMVSLLILFYHILVAPLVLMLLRYLWNGLRFVCRCRMEVWGIRQLRWFNSTLLGKWLCRYGTERDALWRKVIEAKYGDRGGGWCTKPVSRIYGVSVWKSIRSGWMNFFKFLRFDVGDGTRVKFWEDEWCRDCALKVAFLELYSISRTKESLVLEVMWFSDGQLHWDLKHRWICFGICFIPRICGVLVTTNFAKSQHWIEVLRIRVSIILYFLLLSLIFLRKWCGNRRFLLK